MRALLSSSLRGLNAPALAISVAVAASVGLCSCGAAVATEVPFEPSGHYVFLEVRVEGHTLSFAFDSGASGTAINESTASTLGIEPTGRATATGAGGSLDVAVAAGLTLEVGSVRLPRITAYLVPLGHLEEALGRPLDGIIGGHLLAGRIVTIDHDRRTLAVHSRSSFALDDWGPPCAVSGVPGHFTVPGRVELLAGEIVEGPFIVDSGAHRFLAFASPFARKHDLVRRIGKTYRQPSRALTATVADDRIGRVRTFEFCNHKFPAARTTGGGIPVAVSHAQSGVLARHNLGGLLGNAILRRFNIAFDLERQRIFLRPNRRLREPVRSDRSGLFLVQAPGAEVRVEQVVEGSPAAAAGVLAGDVLMSIDGIRSDSAPLEGLRERLRETGARPRLELDRGGSIYTVELELRDLTAR